MGRAILIVLTIAVVMVVVGAVTSKQGQQQMPSQPVQQYPGPILGGSAG